MNREKKMYQKNKDKELQEQHFLFNRWNDEIDDYNKTNEAKKEYNKMYIDMDKLNTLYFNEDKEINELKKNGDINTEQYEKYIEKLNKNFDKKMDNIRYYKYNYDSDGVRQVDDDLKFLFSNRKKVRKARKARKAQKARKYIRNLKRSRPNK